jgi:hypothetical protein
VAHERCESLCAAAFNEIFIALFVFAFFKAFEEENTAFTSSLSLVPQFSCLQQSDPRISLASADV